MTTVGLVMSWIFSVLLALVAGLLFGMGGRLQALFLLAIVLLLLPPVRALLRNLTGKTLVWWGRALLITSLFAAVLLSLTLNPAKSIYKSPKVEAQLMEIYDAKLAEWPVPYRSIFIDTSYGKVHVIESGSVMAPPLLLIHASGVGGWSWLDNVGALSRRYRTYAVDSIGDVGKSVLQNLQKPLAGGAEIAAFYSEVTEKLGFRHSHVAGASIGGYIATSYALNAPERVDKLVLLAPMGYGSTGLTVLLMVLAQSLPLRWVQDRTLAWALGDSPQVKKRFGLWFRLVRSGTVPKPTPPSSFSPEQLQKMQVPVLAFFGTDDKVIGDAEKAIELSKNMPKARVKLVESGHLIAAELPEIVNPAILEFLAQ